MNWWLSKIIYDKSKPVGVYSRALDIKRAKEILNWQPKYSLKKD